MSIETATLHGNPGALPVVVDGDRRKPAIVFANAIGQTARMWQPQIDALREMYCLVRFDQRGHGAARVAPPARSIGDLGRDLVAILDALSLETATLCGLSLGGLVTMWVAAHHADRVRSLVVACSTAFPNNRQKWEQRAALAVESGVSAVIATSSLNWFTPSFSSAHPDLLLELRTAAGSTDPAGYAGCCLALAEVDLRDDLRRISAPTLIIAGGNDRAFPLSDVEYMRQTIPRADLVMLPGVAHLANLEAPDAFTERLRRHVEAPP